MGEALDPIPAAQARGILDAAMNERLGADWEGAGWEIVTRTDYMARVTRGKVNVDFYVDPLGSVTVEEKALNAAQDYGRIVAWSILGLSLMIALLLARLAGAL